LGLVEEHRKFLKHGIPEEVKGARSDQQRGVPPPPLQKPCPDGSELIDLIPPEKFAAPSIPLVEVIRNRRSRRQYSVEPLSLGELSFLLWATQGVRGVSKEGVYTLRTVPSAGARHPFETYAIANRVDSLPQGLYRYMPLNHRLCRLRALDAEFRTRLVDAAMGQSFVGEAAVVLVWTAIPYRSEWRYSARAHKVIVLDAGHVCQNLYLASEAIGAGACAVAAYDQKMMDDLLGVDGSDEFTIYLAPVGKVGRRKGTTD